MAEPRSFGMRVWRHHVLAGVPLAAFLHSLLQFAYDSTTSLADLPLFLLHVVLGMLFGAVILVPVFSLQALIFVFLVRHLQLSLPATAACCGILQVLLVGLWNLTVGIQPNFSGRFPLAVPMMAAGGIAGVVVALMTYKSARKEGGISAAIGE